MLAAASAHLSSRDQPDMLSTHFEYPGQAGPGPAIVVIEDVKLSRRLSTVHLTLWQGGLLSQAPWIDHSVSRRVVLAYATYTNLRTLAGLSMPTRYEAAPTSALPALPDFGALKAKQADDKWELSRLPKGSESWRSLRNWSFYLPRGEPPVPGVVDEWVRMTSGERITQNTLGYVVDSFPWNLHTFFGAPEARPASTAGSQGQKERTRPNEAQGEDQRVGLWFPTVVMNIETKALLPREGVEWLAVRLIAKQIKNGRFDIDILVRTVEGEIVALSHQVAMIVSIERNTKKASRLMKGAL
ncbi:thioesterase-like superfamily-domain-containing protein [Hypoxylon rubiginosum]|uniref:Thioesterase-like superfamily-domain-containing protein n=1 Tax=Hypoxylon rubiginosum TaxID=110542 RepID=A0ACC0CVM7_9PEZI|nr:thioesterase-like superfamily-domain-containing protein [Hypoxylon rubiginosum]